MNDFNSKAASPAISKEVRVDEAGEILGVSASTVMALYYEGLLPGRNAFPPSSSRTSMRFPLEAVLALRNTYQYVDGSIYLLKATSPNQETVSVG